MSCQTQTYLARQYTHRRGLCFITHTPRCAVVGGLNTIGQGICALLLLPSDEFTFISTFDSVRCRLATPTSPVYGLAHAVCLCINCSDILFKFEILLFAVRHKSWARGLGPTRHATAHPSATSFLLHPWANWLNLLLKAATRTRSQLAHNLAIKTMCVRICWHGHFISNLARICNEDIYTHTLTQTEQIT